MVLDLGFAVKKDAGIFMYLFKGALDVFIFPGHNENRVLLCEEQCEAS